MTECRENAGDLNIPSSLRIYLSANVRPVSFLSTIRTLPKAPLPTTRRRRKWLRLTGFPRVSILLFSTRAARGGAASGALRRGFGLQTKRVPAKHTRIIASHRFPLRITHSGGDKCWTEIIYFHQIFPGNITLGLENVVDGYVHVRYADEGICHTVKAKFEFENGEFNVRRP